MSLMKTLAKVAVGVAVAKGVSAMAKRGPVGGDPNRPQGQGGGLLGQLGGALGGGAGGAGGGLAGGLGGLLSGRGGMGGQPGTHGGQTGGGLGGGLGGALASGGLGGLLSSLGGAAQQRGGIGGAARDGNLGGTGTGLDGLLGGLLGGAAGGGLLGQLAGQAPRPKGEPEADFGTVLNSQFDDDRQDIPPTPEQDAAAGLMLRAMIQAAKADGEIDQAEREKLLGQLDNISPEEQRFVQEELQAPVDPEGLARQVPDGLEPQVYAMSLMAIDLDSRAEAEHLHRLAQAMNLERDTINAIHERMGVPPLYRS